MPQPLTSHSHSSYVALVAFAAACRYFVGRATGGIKECDQPGSIGRVRYDKGDCEIEVEWCQRDASGGEERRTFKVWAADDNANDPGPQPGKKYSFNSTELRLISNPEAATGAAVQLEMQSLPPVGGVPLHMAQPSAARSSARVSSQVRPSYRNVVRAKTTVRADPPKQMWEISSGSERAVLDNNW